MKKLLWLILIVPLLLLPFGVKAQSISSKSPVKFNGSWIENITNVSGATGFRIIVCQAAGNCDTISFLRSSGTSQVQGTRAVASFEKVLADTIKPTHLIFGSTDISSIGQGLVASGGILQTSLTNLISTNEIVNQTVGKNDLDTTATWAIGGIYHVTTAVADSAYKSKRYIDSTLFGQIIPGFAIGSLNDNYIPKWDSINARWKMTVDAGSTTGDNVKWDSAGSVFDPTAPIFKAGTGIVMSHGASGDTVYITSTAGSAISLAGQAAGTMTATSTWDWNNGRFDSVKTIDVDSIHIDKGLVVNGDSVKVFGTGILADSSDFGITTRAGKTLFLNYTNTGNTGQINVGSIAGSYGFTVKGDSLTGTYRKAVLKNLKEVITDTLTIGSVVFNSTARGSQGNATDISTKGVVSDSLVNYVRKSDENLQDSTTSGSGTFDWEIWTNGLNSDRGFHFKRVPSSQSMFYPVTGDMLISSARTTGGVTTGTLTLQGGAGSAGFFSGANFNATNIDSVGTLTVAGLEYLYSGLKFQAATNKTSAGITILPTVGTGSYTLRLPTGLPVSTQAFVCDVSGNMGFQPIGSGSGGGFPVSINTGSTANTVDSSVWIGRNGVSLSITQRNGVADTVYASASQLSPGMFGVADSIATNYEIKDSLAAFFSTRIFWDTGSVAKAPVVRTLVDSLPFKSGVTNAVEFFFRGRHSGADTLDLSVPSTYGMSVGNTTGATALAGDSAFVTNTRKGLLIFGNAKSTGNFLDSILADSMTQQRGRFATGGGGTGDITQVGSVTSGDAFATDATTQGKTFGFPSRARFVFDSGSTVSPSPARYSYVYLSNGRLGIGNAPTTTTTSLYDLDVIRDSTAPVTAEIYNQNNTRDTAAARLIIRTGGTSGGDPVIQFNDGAQIFTAGIDNTDDNFTLSASSTLGTSDMLKINGTTSILLNGLQYRGSVTADSMLTSAKQVRKYPDFTTIDTTNGGLFHVKLASLDSTFTGTSKLATTNTNWRKSVLLPIAVLPKGAITAADSTWLGFGRVDAEQSYLVVDSSSDGSGALRDSFDVKFEATDAYTVDSINFLYKVANAGDSINAVTIYGPKTGNLYADSVYQTNTGQNLNATSLTQKGYTKAITLAVGQELRVRFSTYLGAANRYAKIVYVHVWGKRIS